MTGQASADRAVMAIAGGGNQSHRHDYDGPVRAGGDGYAVPAPPSLHARADDVHHGHAYECDPPLRGCVP